ncbi:MAG TPA: 50S ribosomal protein L25 [bacterium]|nr:50S ribosomal protein L25 [bacterium]HOG37938.1 50S ribosomal protein L25 [bacterium]HQI02996.1 50S ribosomal protein L25 [bacterium]
MTELILKAQKRENFGGLSAKNLIASGYLPVVVYGPKHENLNLQVSYSEFMKIFNTTGESQVLNLEFEDKKIPVIIHDIAKDHITGSIIHADLYRFDAKNKLTVEIPINFSGESKAVKELGAILVKAMDRIEIECLASQIISSIEVDISKLENYNDMILVSDLEVPSGVEILTDGDQPIVIAKPAKAETVEEEKSETPETTEKTKEPEETKEESQK